MVATPLLLLEQVAHAHGETGEHVLAREHVVTTQDLRVVAGVPDGNGLIAHVEHPQQLGAARWSVATPAWRRWAGSRRRWGRGRRRRGRRTRRYTPAAAQPR